MTSLRRFSWSGSGLVADVVTRMMSFMSANSFFSIASFSRSWEL